MRGRKPIPTAIKLLRGNPGRRKLNPDEPSSAALDVAVPREIRGDARARAEWRRTIVPAIERRQIRAADRALAIAHCDLYSSWQAELADARKQPHIIALGKAQTPMPNPARTLAHRTLKLLLAVDVELGLTPSARTRVKAARETEPAASKWAGLLA